MDQGWRNEIRSRRDDHLVERSMLRPAMIAVRDSDLNVAAALPTQSLLCLSGELFDDFDAVHLPRQLREDRRLVAQPGADLEHGIVFAEVQQIGHQRDNERLRDRLLEPDRKRNVGVGIRLKFDRYELMPRHLAYRTHHALIESRLAEHAADVKYAGGDFHQHLLAQDIEIFDTHCAISGTARRGFA